MNLQIWLSPFPVASAPASRAASQARAILGRKHNMPRLPTWMGNMKPLKNQICWSILGVFGLQHWSALIIIGLSIGKSSHPKSNFLSSFIPTGWWHAKMLIRECQAFLTRFVKHSNGVMMLFNPNFSKSYWSHQNPCLGTTNRSQKMHIWWNASWCVLGWFIIIRDGSCSWNQKEYRRYLLGKPFSSHFSYQNCYL